MTIAPVLNKLYPMNAAQRAIISHKQGPLRVIAGPGSGKTRSLILLAMNLLLCGDAQPSELILCTYTDKAASDMQDRLTKIARDVHYQQDLAPLHIGTIHSICKQLITENSHYLSIENDFSTLNQFTQQLLIFEELETICRTPAIKRFFQDRWGSPWKIARELGSTFDKITEELIFEQMKAKYAPVALSSLQTGHDRLYARLTIAYQAYQKLLEQRNCLDFAHLQKCVYNLLCDPKTAPRLTKGIRYVLVDEYQDTNYIQEQILTRLASATPDRNLCVVGDEDQALYRFRGATVRNILEFEQTFPGCETIQLMTNYRSHATIIEQCNTWITAIDWANPEGVPFRTPKSASASHQQHAQYPAVCTMLHVNIDDEAEQFAELVVSLKQQGKIQDYCEVALLLYSVKQDFSAPYIRALQKREIPAFCPRATSYFDHAEVCLLLGCFARILDFDAADSVLNDNDAFPDYLAECQQQLKKALPLHLHLQTMLLRMREEMPQGEQESGPQGKPLLDYFYRLVTVSPFLHSLKGTRTQLVRPRHLEKLSDLLQTFQRYYRHTGITQQNRREIAYDFFQKFLPLLYSSGLHQDEAAAQSIPEGYVPLLTIHQAKGLEFPVVVVGRLDTIFASSDSQKQKVFQEFSQRKPFEPAARIPDFDLHRLYYVAFSRAKRLLVLMAVKRPGKPFAVFWQRLPGWSQMDALKNMPEADEREAPAAPRSRYGLTNDLQLYKTCPRQFQFFRTYDFAPSPNGSYFSGQLVHQTLEHIHRVARDGELASLNEEALAKIFERKFRALRQAYPFPVDGSQQAKAWQQILRYFQHNREMLHRVEAAELPVQVDRKKYVLTGKIDLLVKTAHGFDLIDFKTFPRPEQNSPLLERCEQQVHFYAHAVEQSHGQRPERLFLYWTAEERRENVLLEIPYQAERMHRIHADLESVVENIEKQKFHVSSPPAVETCQRCDLRHLCREDRIIEL